MIVNCLDCWAKLGRVNLKMGGTKFIVYCTAITTATVYHMWVIYESEIIHVHTLPITLITSNYTDWSSNLALESPRILLRGFATSQPTKEENSRPMLTQTLEGRHRVVSLCGTVSSQPPTCEPGETSESESTNKWSASWKCPKYWDRMGWLPYQICQ